jgi:hypothetical protein
MSKVFHPRLLVALAVVIFIVLGTSVVNAASPSLSRSYNATTSIPSGSLVSIVSGKTGYVEPANTANGQRLLGVASNGNQSLLAVNPSSGTVQVVTDGTVSALVSTLNGKISVGSQVSVSPFNGVGMKASTGLRIIGLSETSFNTGTAGATSQQVTDKSGHKHNITVGYVRLEIAIGSASSTSALSGIQNFAEALTGHPISIVRIIISLIVATVALASIITLIYASIYGGIISIGRNPLAKYPVLRTLTLVLGMTVLIAAVATATIFLLLEG